MQDKFVLLAAEHEQAHSQRDDRTQAADPDHAPGEARAVQHRGAEVMYQYSGLKRMTWERLSSTLPTTSGFICSGS